MKIAIAGADQGAALYLAEKAGFEIVSEAEAGFVLELREKLTVSKNKMYEFLVEEDIPVPARFPDGSEPYIVRPDNASGSRGIWVTEDFCEAGGAVNCGFLVQEYLDGPVRCAQVTGIPGAYVVHPVLALCADDRHIPQSAAPAEDPALEKLAARIARKLGLRGYLCVKAVNGRVISLDDRLCGLAPMALYDLCGANVLKALLERPEA